MLKFKNLIVRKGSPFRGLKLQYEDIDYIEFVDPIEEDAYIKVITLSKKFYELSIHEVDFDGIKVDGYIGTWYTIDRVITQGQLYYLLEHEEYGDETEHLIIDHTGNFILDDVYNGFDDLDYFLETN